ncbi:MAG: hypothetical protein AB7S26_33405 [Sandaracinaceae bacterium]
MIDPRRSSTLALALALGLALVPACTRPSPNMGAECSLNSDCGEPLVCGLGRCRRQCLDSRDCGAGLRCLAMGDSSSCQLTTEVSCTLTSDCTGGLVCTFGTCSTACVTDRDCPPGATCQAVDGSTNACVEVLAELCIYDSDCPEPLVCGSTQQCELECREDRDCDAPRHCVLNLCQLVDGGG